MSIILRTGRIHLREIQDQDLVALGRIYADEQCMQFYPGTKSATDTLAWFQELAFDSYRLHGYGLWAVIDNMSGEVIGDCGITQQRTPAGTEPEIGYHLWRDFWGKGLATEAARACRGYAFGTLGLRRVVSITSPENIPSQKVAQRVHDRKEVYRKQPGSDATPVDRFLYISENF